MFDKTISNGVATIEASKSDRMKNAVDLSEFSFSNDYKMQKQIFSLRTHQSKATALDKISINKIISTLSNLKYKL